MLDLQIENRTATAFRLGLAITGTHLCGRWTADIEAMVGYHVYETEHLTTNDAPGVFTRRNVLRREVLNASGEQVANELVAVNHARMMYQPFLAAEPHQGRIEEQ